MSLGNAYTPTPLAAAPDGGDLKVLNALARSPGVFHSGFISNATSVRSWVEWAESVLVVFYEHDLDCLPFARLRPVLTVNLDDSVKRFVNSLSPATWAEVKRLFVERYGRTTR